MDRNLTEHVDLGDTPNNSCIQMIERNSDSGGPRSWTNPRIKTYQTHWIVIAFPCFPMLTPSGFRCKTMLHWFQVFWRPGLCASSLHVQKGMRGRRVEVRGAGEFLWAFIGWFFLVVIEGETVKVLPRGLKCWFISFHIYAIYVYIYECIWQLDDNEHIVINICIFGICYSFEGVFQCHIFILSSPRS